MSYIQDVEASVLRDKISHIEKDQFVNACKDLQEVMGMNVPYDPNDTLDNQCEWVSSSVRAINQDDDFALTTWSVLKKLGYEIPEKEAEDIDGGENTEQEATEVPAEAEVERKDPPANDGKDKEQVKIRRHSTPKEEPEAAEEPKAEEPKAKKERKSKKEPKEPKEKKPRGAGVIAFLRAYVREHGEQGFTLDTVHGEVCKAFPDRDPAKLLGTCKVQLGNRMAGECGLVFRRERQYDESGKAIGCIIYVMQSGVPVSRN